MTTTKNSRAAWLKAGTSQCSIPPKQPEQLRRLVLLGAPGVGKGTQAELLSERLGACHLSTGDIFRAAKMLPPNEQSPALTEAIAFMQRGELVPDSTVLSIVRERGRCLNCSCGFLLDGFPRTVAQAEALDKILKEDHLPLDAVIDYEMPIEEIVSRLSGRRSCSGCGAVYHVTSKPPHVKGICDHCGSSLYQRDDDKPESIRVRMNAYRKSTMPLIQYYRQRGLLVSIPATGSPQEVCERTLAALSAAANGAAHQPL